MFTRIAVGFITDKEDSAGCVSAAPAFVRRCLVLPQTKRKTAKRLPYTAYKKSLDIAWLSTRTDDYPRISRRERVVQEATV